MLNRPLDPLTPRELEILKLIQDGLSDQEIGERLFLSTGTVKWHIKNIYSKVGVHKRTAAVAQARNWGLLEAVAPRPTLKTTNHNLPTFSSPLVGREIDTHNVVALLRSDECRLVSLLGLGGIGKTRLAIQCGSQLVDSLTDGVWFISVDTVPRGFLPPAIASILPDLAIGQQDVREQLLRYLRHKRLLLILDSFEHMLGEVDYIIQILDQAPSVKILVTTRETLDLTREWVYRVAGLTVPRDAEQTNPQSYGAINLFIQRARQVDPTFSSTRDIESIVRICQLVGGMPLAIELVTSWLHLLSTAEILSEMERDRKILSSTYRDLPARHHNINDVLTQSWKLLSKDQQSAMLYMSVLRGGGSRQAMEDIAGVTLTMLMSLVNRALLSVSKEQRYDMHPLVRQYAEDLLLQIESRAFDARLRHSRHYALVEWETTSMSLGEESENVWAGFQFAVSIQDVELINRYSKRLWQYFGDYGWYMAENQILDLYRHSIALFEDRVSLNNLQEDRDTLLTLYESIASCLHTSRRYSEVREVCNTALFVTTADDRIRRARLFRKIGSTYNAQRSRPDRILEAYNAAETALGSARPEADRLWWNEWVQTYLDRAMAYYTLNELSALQQSLEKVHHPIVNLGSAIQIAKFHHLHALYVTREERFRPSTRVLDYELQALNAILQTNDQRETAWIVFGLGFVYLWRDELALAEEYMLRAISMAQKVGDTMGTYVTAMAYIPYIYRRYQQVDLVESWALRGLEGAREAQSPLYIGIAHSHLGWVTYRREQYETAREHCNTTLAHWKQMTILFSMYWMCRATLLALELRDKNLIGAIEQARELLDPQYQPLLDPLPDLLRHAVDEFGIQQEETTYAQLQAFCDQARPLGYI